MKKLLQAGVKYLVGFIQFLLPVMVIAASIWGARLLIATKPEIPKEKKQKEATLVTTMSPRSAQERVWSTGYGTVKAHRQLQLYPQVNGLVIEQHPHLIQGGTIHQDEVVVQVDPRDYQIQLTQARGDLTQAKFELKVEQGRQIIAQREWQLLGNSAKQKKMSQELALRKPHLKARQAAVLSAESRVRKSQIDLERTTISAPFNALVLQESVEVGQLVTPQTAIATMVSTDAFRVQVNIPIKNLSAVLSKQSGERKTVRVIQEVAPGVEFTREGVVAGLLGDLEPNGRMARILVLVSDPLALKTKEGKRPLLIGSFVRVEIPGPKVGKVFQLPRSTLRKKERIWVKDENNRLAFRNVKVLIRGKEHVWVTGLKEGEKIITSNLPVAIPGMLLKNEESAQSQAQEQKPTKTGENQANEQSD